VNQHLALDGLENMEFVFSSSMTSVKPSVGHSQ